jgi:DNA-binding NarL/FixJ family response regulator
VIRVLVADDEPVVRAGVRAVLAADDGLEVVAEAGTGRAAVDLTLRHRPDVVLMDIRMPELDGLGAAAEILRHRPEQAVVILTTFGEAAYLERAVALGVAGFLVKSGDPFDLLRGVRAVADGGACLSPAAARHVLRALRPARPGDAGASARAAAAVEALPPRERDVLRLVAEGRSNAEIATDLALTEGTVKGYVSSLLATLGVRNRVEAALVAWEAGRSSQFRGTSADRPP